MSNLWYRQPVTSIKFKEGLKSAPMWQLKNLIVIFKLEEMREQKVKSEGTVIKKELERRKNKGSKAKREGN